MFCSKCGANVSEGAAFCPQCGQPVAAAPVAVTPPPPSIPLSGAVPPPPSPPSPPSYAPSYAPRPYSQQYSVPTPQVLYAGFWLRVVAAVIDGFVLAIPSGILFLLLFASTLPELMRSQGDPALLVFTFLPRFMLLAVIYIIGAWVYWAKMESSSWQATLGKRALGLYVTDLTGRPINFGKASGRFWAGRGLSIVPYLGGLYFLIDCICAGVTEHKQAIHDTIASCLVLRKA